MASDRLAAAELAACKQRGMNAATLSSNASTASQHAVPRPPPIAHRPAHSRCLTTARAAAWPPPPPGVPHRRWCVGGCSAEWKQQQSGRSNTRSGGGGWAGGGWEGAAARRRHGPLTISLSTAAPWLLLGAHNPSERDWPPKFKSGVRWPLARRLDRVYESDRALLDAERPARSRGPTAELGGPCRPTGWASWRAPCAVRDCSILQQRRRQLAPPSCALRHPACSCGPSALHDTRQEIVSKSCSRMQRDGRLHRMLTGTRRSWCPPAAACRPPLTCAAPHSPVAQLQPQLVAPCRRTLWSKASAAPSEVRSSLGKSRLMPAVPARSRSCAWLIVDPTVQLPAGIVATVATYPLMTVRACM